MEDVNISNKKNIHMIYLDNINIATICDDS